jgi:hypothetical protein
MGRAKAISLFLLLAVSARALVVDGATSANATNPGNGLPWSNVGTVGSASGIYLGTFGGGYWALTAAHVGVGNLTLGGTTYQAVAGSSVRVLNADNSNTDLVLFRLASNPGLANLRLASTNPAQNSTVTLVGFGQVEGALNYWTRTVVAGANNDSWGALGTSSAGSNINGYLLTSSIGQRWGQNQVSGTASYDIGTGVTQSFYTVFSGNDAQGAGGDSGGAAFYFDGSQWFLAGMMGAVGLFENQPSSTAMAGNVTYLGSIASYNSFITTAIPEPNTWAAVCGVVAVAAVLGQRRRRK